MSHSAGQLALLSVGGKRITLEASREPNFNISGYGPPRMAKTAGKNADDGIGIAVDLQSPSDDIRAAAIGAPPQCIADDCGRREACKIHVIRAKQPPEL